MRVIDRGGSRAALHLVTDAESTAIDGQFSYSLTRAAGAGEQRPARRLVCPRRKLGVAGTCRLTHPSRQRPLGTFSSLW